jgi:Zn finger protein HypA/HybF involved in hydrogenase expression
VKYSNESIIEAVKVSRSWREVCVHLNAPRRSGTQAYLSKRGKKLNIDTSHFLGRSYNLCRTDFKKKDALSYCHKDSNIISHRLKNILIRDGYKEAKCERCGINEWMGEPVVLELDHINSDHFDNTFHNLQILCPNCHSAITRKRRLERSEKIIKLERRKKRIEEDKIWKHKIKRERTKPKKSRPRKVIWPFKEELRDLRVTLNWSAIGRKYGVSDNAVRKWAKRYGLI